MSDSTLYLNVVFCCLHAGNVMGIKDIRPKSGKVPKGPQVVKKLPDVLRCTYDGALPITQNPSRDS